MAPAKPRPAPLALARALGLTASSGVLYGISFPPLALRPLAWVALVPLLVAIRRSNLPRAIALGALWACVMTDVTSDCLPGAVVNYYQQSPAIGWLMLLGATVITMVPYYSTFAGAYWALGRRFRAGLPFAAAAAWVAVELARVTVLGGNPWALSGYSQSGVLPLIQIAEVTGVHGVGFVLVAVNAALAEVWLARSDPAPSKRQALLGLGSAVAVLACVLAYGSARLASLAARSSRSEPVRIAILQGNLDLGTQWRQEMYGRNLDVYLKLTADAIRASAPQLIFWPESAMTFFLPDEPAYQSAIGRVLQLGGAELVAGGPRVVKPTDGSDPTYFNSTFLVSPQGRVLGWQDKTKLLPFAEYFPLQSIDLVRRSFGRARQFSPGDPRPPLPSIAGGAGVIVCNEAMFPEIAAQAVVAGAELLVNPANDSWFGSLKYSLQALDIVRLRAVEQRRFVVRTSTAGPSAIIDPSGRIIAQSGTFTREWLSGAVSPQRSLTPYARVGDLFAGASAVAALGAFVHAAWGSTRASETSDPRRADLV